MGSSRLKTGLPSPTLNWGSKAKVRLYLDRCQVDTPERLVEATWKHVLDRRPTIGKVIDFGAGDGRFALGGHFDEYFGYEIDPKRSEGVRLPKKAMLVNRCAFSETIDDADLAIGNPPYVRNQDLPAGWRTRAAKVVHDRTGVSVSGLANAWMYFAFLSMASTREDGLVALVLPYEWVSRPSSKSLRDYIARNNWDVIVYRLRDETFDRVLTTASITIIDKRTRAGVWSYFEESTDGTFRALRSPSGHDQGVLLYTRTGRQGGKARLVRRGLSPGTQRVFTLTEGERVRLGLRAGADVVPCVTTLKPFAAGTARLTRTLFNRHYRDGGKKCWLIRTDRPPSLRLKAYLEAVPKSRRSTSTCRHRKTWWQFPMPEPPRVLVATGFCNARPKATVNSVGAVAVGGVSGVYGIALRKATRFVTHLASLDLSQQIVAHSNGLRKIEMGQLATIVSAFNSAHSKAAS